MDNQIEILRYTPEFKDIWNDFVESSKNGTFLFNRGYMDYHSDRFEDNSYLIYRKGKLYCLMPACKMGDELVSHAGLTYGGLVMSDKTTTEAVLEIFEQLIKRLKEEGFKRWVYKPVPHIYHKLPAEEDLYALFRNDARLIIRNVSCTVYQRKRLKFATDRKASLRRAESNGAEVKSSSDFHGFWEILSDNLWVKYGAKPVHSLKEMEGLASNFPENIKLYCAYKDGETLGGVLCYITSEAVHCQYISANEEGKKIGAIDAIINLLINEKYKDVAYFDFGISNENGGRYLNESLIYQKEGFGGRAICYDTYEVLLH